MAVQCYSLYAPEGPPGPSLFAGADKVVHLLLFAVPAAISVGFRLGPRVVVPLLAVHAPLSEALQHLLLPHRSGDVGDVVADLAGVLVGVLAGLLVASRHAHCTARRGKPLT